MSILNWFKSIFTPADPQPVAETGGTFPDPSTMPGYSVFIATYGQTKVYKCNLSDTIYWTGKADVDADGSPHAYHPRDTPGLDALECAGHPGNWYGIVTRNGIPVIQGCIDPAPGFYVSPTSSVRDYNRHESDPFRYHNAETQPYCVIPGGFPIKGLLGKRCRVEYNGKSVDGIVADVGPEHKIGEISIAMAKLLGIPESPRHGGVPSGVTYTIFL